MTNVHSINSLANSYADRKLAHQQLNEHDRVLFRNRIIWDFSVTGFNVATVATIITVALAIFVSSPLFLILFLLSYGTRNAFMKNIDQTALPEGNQGLRDPLLPARRAQIAEHLEIDNENWSAVSYQLLAFRIWMSYAPTQPAAPAVQPPVLEQQ